MKVKAQVSFAGAVSMRQGEERELDSESVALQDLLQAGYVVGINTASVPTETANKPANKPAKKGGE